MPKVATITSTNARATPNSRSSSASYAAQAHALSELAAAGQPTLITCEHTAEGVLSAVGLSYLAHLTPEQTRLSGAEAAQPRLGEAVFAATTDVDLALRVSAGFERTCARGCSRARGGRCRGGCEGACVRRLAYACASDDPRMPEVVHRYLRLGFEIGPKIRSANWHPDAAALEELADFVVSECEHTRQFVRFSHMADGSYLAVFRPEANTIPLVARYFVARMGTERFCLVDPVHRIAAFYDHKLAIVGLDAAMSTELAERDDLASDEFYVRALWQRFYGGVTLPGRSPSERGYDLRASWMPKRFWTGLTEFMPEADAAELEIPKRYQAQRQRPLLIEIDTPSRLPHANLK